jgi:uroporphyrinogen-III synthase
VSLPLEGRRILVTRRPEQAEGLASALTRAGAEVVELPLLEIQPPEDTGPLDTALGRLHAYDWLVFTSANAVSAVRGRLDALGLSDAAVGRGTPVACVGAATSTALHAAFPEGSVSLMPAGGFGAEGLLEAFRVRGVTGERFLLPSSDRAADLLPKGLREAGATADVVTAYRTLTPPDLAARLTAILKQDFDIALFASPSAVAGFEAAAGRRTRGFPAGVIGPVTRARAEAAGLHVKLEAKPSTDAGMLAEILAFFASRS